MASNEIGCRYFSHKCVFAGAHFQFVWYRKRAHEEIFSPLNSVFLVTLYSKTSSILFTLQHRRKIEERPAILFSLKINIFDGAAHPHSFIQQTIKWHTKNVEHEEIAEQLRMTTQQKNISSENEKMRKYRHPTRKIIFTNWEWLRRWTVCLYGVCEEPMP